jgi:hypothetical protein
MSYPCVLGVMIVRKFDPLELGDASCNGREVCKCADARTLPALGDILSGT